MEAVINNNDDELINNDNNDVDQEAIAINIDNFQSNMLYNFHRNVESFSDSPVRFILVIDNNY